MTEENIRIMEQIYGVSMILIRGLFFGVFADLFINKETLSRSKNIVLSVIITIEGIVLFAIPYSTKGLYSIISLLTIVAVFYFYNQKILPHIIFVFFLWQNVFYVWHLINFAVFNSISDYVTAAIDYSREGAVENLWNWMFILMALQGVFLAVFLLLEYFVTRKICTVKYDMSWTEALYLSIYSAVSYIICYIIVEVMVVPLDKEVFVLLDEKQDLRFTLPILAVLIFIGEMSAIATWQRYRRLKEEDLRLQEQLQEQEFIRKKIEYTEKYHERIRTLRHDMAGKLMILKSFLEKDRIGDAKEFLGDMDIELSSEAMQYATNNPVTDAVINEAAAQAGSMNCDFKSEFLFPDDNGISALDMGIILNNLIDNALDGVLTVVEDDRFIRLIGEQKDNFYLIKIENSFDGKLKRASDDSIISTKKMDSDADKHGLGLKSVMGIADKYLGAVDINSENKVFKVKVMLQKKN